MRSKPLAVCVSPRIWWSEFGPKATDYQLDWVFFDVLTSTKNIIYKLVKKPNLQRCIVCYKCVKYVENNQASVLITHGPEITFWCAFFILLFGVKAKHVAWVFNFPKLKTGLKLLFYKLACTKVDKFVVFSNMEKYLYSEYFKIPKAKIDFIRWSGGEQIVARPHSAIEHGNYICAIGSNNRDYSILVNAIQRLQDVNLVIVAKKENLKGINIQTHNNIKIYSDIPFSDCMNLLKFSKFMVLPIKDLRLSSGCVSLLSAMYLEKGALVTKSPGIEDYIIEGETAITFMAGIVDDLTKKIKLLWDNDELCKKLGKNGRAFAIKYCSEEVAAGELKMLLTDFGIMPKENKI